MKTKPSAMEPAAPAAAAPAAAPAKMVTAAKVWRWEWVCPVCQEDMEECVCKVPPKTPNIITQPTVMAETGRQAPTLSPDRKRHAKAQRQGTPERPGNKMNAIAKLQQLLAHQPNKGNSPRLDKLIQAQLSDPGRIKRCWEALDDQDWPVCVAYMEKEKFEVSVAHHCHLVHQMQGTKGEEWDIDPIEELEGTVMGFKVGSHLESSPPVWFDTDDWADISEKTAAPKSHMATGKAGSWLPGYRVAMAPALLPIPAILVELLLELPEGQRGPAEWYSRVNKATKQLETYGLVPSEPMLDTFFAWCRLAATESKQHRGSSTMCTTVEEVEPTENIHMIRWIRTKIETLLLGAATMATPHVGAASATPTLGAASAVTVVPV